MSARAKRLAGALILLWMVPSLGALAAPTAAQPPQLRLGDAARPIGYEIALTLRPEAAGFPGRVVIDLELRETTSVLWLHGKELQIETASLSAGGAEQTATVLDGGDEWVGFAVDEPVGPGPARLTVRYEGLLPEDEIAGLFRRQVGGEWYIFSQLEASDARRVFPCFDEPAFKVPFQLTLTVAEDQQAFSNTPVESETEAAAGMKTIRFRRTRPLPSYLLAMAVGPFEVVDTGRFGGKETPVRIITPRGRSAEAAWAAESTGPILEALEAYFGTPYPYEKLDQIAVLNFGGAMENPGLVTYDQRLILSKPEDDTVPRRRRYALVCAHELAHMWFGDLVTMAWWDDTWLSESFATWMANRTIERWRPDWDIQVSTVRRRGGAMRADSLDTARRMRQPIESSHDIANAFDSITYEKGASVLEMFEAWVGEERLRRAVRDYLTRHADGNATSDDFLAALERAAGEEVSEAFASFVDQNGVPVVTTRLDCGDEGLPRLSLTQKRYLPAGSAAAAERTWRIPVCVEFGAGGTVGRECVLLAEREATLPLGSAAGCPDWVLPNSDMAGYYRVDCGEGLLDGLLSGAGRHLSLVERVGVIDDLRAQVLAGRLPYGEALARIPVVLEDRNRHIVGATVSIVDDVADDLVPAGMESDFARFVRAMYGEQARALGWAAKPDDDDDTRLLRETLLPLVADEGAAPELIAQARALAGRWLDDRAAIEPEMVEHVLAVAARHGDEALWKRLYEQAKSTGEEEDRARLLAGMGGFADPVLVARNLEIGLSEEFPILEILPLLFGALQEPTTREMAFAHVRRNFDGWAGRLPEAFRGFMPHTASWFCDEAAARDVEGFFRPRVEDLAGGPRSLDQTLEVIRLCAAKRALHLASVADFLERFE
jgi:alanyl aminopeptidase